MGKAQWMKKLIKNVGNWIGRGHGSVNYHLTQVLTGHGCFSSYLMTMKLAQNDWCWYCGEHDDNVYNTSFICERWNNHRREANKRCGDEVTPDSMVTQIIEEEEKWDTINGMIRAIWKKKNKARGKWREIENKGRQNQTLDCENAEVAPV